MSQIIEQLKQHYTIRCIGNQLFVAEKEFFGKDELQNVYYGENGLIARSDYYAFKKGETVTCEITFRVDDSGEIFVIEHKLFNTKTRHAHAFHHENYMKEGKMWIVKQQLLKDAGLPREYQQFNWDKEYEAVRKEDIEKELYGLVLLQPLTISPFLLTIKSFVEVPLLSYELTRKQKKKHLYVTNAGTYRWEDSETSFETFKEAYSYVKRWVKSNRIRYLF